VRGSTTAGPSLTVIYVMDGAIENAEHPPPEWHEPEMPFNDALKEEVGEGLSDLAPVEFIAKRESVVDGNESRSPGDVRNGGVLISLGPIRGESKSVKVGCNSWVSGKGALWLAYVLEPRGDVWKVTGHCRTDDDLLMIAGRFDRGSFG
jgi:hypothetical protein